MALSKFDIGSGIHTEKAQLLAGAPTHIVRSSAEIIRELQALDADEIIADRVGGRRARRGGLSVTTGPDERKRPCWI
jgi:hypothetical protein